MNLPSDLGRLARGSLVVIGLTALVVLVLLLFWRGTHVLLVAFAGVLLAVLLRGLVDLVKTWTHLPEKLAAPLVVITFFALVIGGFWIIVPNVVGQMDQLTRQVSDPVAQIEAKLMQYEWGRRLLRMAPDVPGSAQPQAPAPQEAAPPPAPETGPTSDPGAPPGQVPPDTQAGQQPPPDTQATGGQSQQAGGEQPGSSGELISPSTLLSQLQRFFSLTLGTIADLFVILVVAIYLTFDPGIYVRSALRLVPKPKRDRAQEVLNKLGHALRWWLVGRMSSMVIVGVLTGLGLLVLGVPLALTLGLIAAVFDFIPNVGPIIAAVPGILVGFSEGTDTALFVTLLYIGIQTLEAYLITPLIEKSVVSIQPALLILFQFLMGLLAGVLGLLLATPLLVVIIVLVQMLYLEDALGEPVKVLGE